MFDISVVQTSFVRSLGSKGSGSGDKSSPASQPSGGYGQQDKSLGDKAR